MADDSNKVVISLDLEAGVFRSSIAGVETVIDNLGKKSEDSGKKGQASFLEFNAVLEVGMKIMEGFEKALATMEKSEAAKNQAQYLKNFAAEYGINADKLMDVIHKVTQGSIDYEHEHKAAIDLLQAGVKANLIPTFVEYANKLKEIKGLDFNQTVKDLAGAVEAGRISYKQYEVHVNSSTDAMRRQDQLFVQIQEKLNKLGTGYQNTAAKTSTFFSDTWSSIEKGFGESFNKIASSIEAAFGNSSNLISIKIKDLEEKLKQVQEIEAKGGRAVGETGLLVTSKGIQEEINKLKAESADLEKKNQQAIEEGTKAINQEKYVATLMTAEQQKRASLTGQLYALQSRGAEEQKKFGATSIETDKQIFATKRALIEEAAQQEIADFAQKPHTYKQFAAEVEEVERKKYDAIQALRVNDLEFTIESENAKLEAIKNSDNMAFATAQNKEAIEVEQEKRRNERRLEELRQEGLSKEQFHEQMELEEAAHQKKLAAITKSYSEVNSTNFRLGWNQGMASLEQQFGNFAVIVQRMTVKSHSIMTNSFVQAAKGHGNAMELMKQQFLEMIGTEMIQSGIWMTLSGLWPPNPVALGAGAALIAAGSALVGASGGAEASAGGGGGGFEGGGSGLSGPAQAQQQQLERKSASITIMGDYLNSRETQMHLAEVLRQNSDITDYAIVAQGKSF